jgi:hypothetical protein
VLEALRRRERELGRPPTSSEMRAPGPGYPTSTIVGRKLGSWSEACRALLWRLEPVGSRGDEAMLAALRAASWELGDQLTQARFAELARQRDWPAPPAIRKRFGSWTSALHASGPAARGKVPVWTEAEIIAALRAGERKLGRSPTWKDWKTLAGARGWPSATVLTGRYGRWRDVLDAAGLIPGSSEP